jgi:protein phosphatase PTC7
MFHAHRYSKGAWAGEPETDPTQDLDEPVEGWELTPQECLDLSYGGVLREKSVQGGMSVTQMRTVSSCFTRVEYRLYYKYECVHWVAQSSKVCHFLCRYIIMLRLYFSLGDSGFVIIRSAQLLHVQPPQTHYFNCPKQLSKIPPELSRGNPIVDHPSDADVVCVSRSSEIIIIHTLRSFQQI